MGKLIKLPGGVLFNPETGEIQGGNFGRPPAPFRVTNHPTRHSSNRFRFSYWGRFNHFISEIGNWFADHSESITNYCGMALLLLSWGGFGIFIISMAIKHGILWALIAGVIGGSIFYYVSMILLGIFIVVMNIVLGITRYLFYNAYTFLIPTLLVGALYLSNQMDLFQDKPITVSNTVSYQPNHYCDVSTTLNVREYPYTNAQIIGQLKRYDEVYVYTIVENNFAKIDFNGRIAYVSADYLKPKSTSATDTNATQTQPHHARD